MDGLENDQQRVEAWKSCWKKSLVGMAIVSKTGEFLSVNDQWVRILGVPATEFYGNSFQDITPNEELHEDMEVSHLVYSGKIDSYVIDKSYNFKNGSQASVTLLVTRVPMDLNKPFICYLSRILRRKEAKDVVLTNPERSNIYSQSESQEVSNDFWVKIVEFVVKYWLTIVVGSAVFVGGVAGAFNEFFQMGFF